MTNLIDLDRAALADKFFEATGRSVKPTTYTKAKFIELIEAAKPAIEFEPGSNESTPYPAPAEEPAKPTTEELLDEGRCPLCGGDAANQTAAGEEGTHLGDTCNFCHECDKTYSVFNGEEVDATIAAAPTKKRRILNPQVKINAKTEACAKEGIEVFYDKNSRLWVFSDNHDGVTIHSMTSKQFAEYTPAELTGFIQSKQTKK